MQSSDTQVQRRGDPAGPQRDGLKIEHLEAILEAIPGPVFYKNADGIYLNCNRPFAEGILGLPKEEIIGRGLDDLPDRIPPELAEVYRTHDQVLLESRGCEFYEAPVRVANGETHTFLFRKSCYLDENGEPVGILGVMTDLTAQHRVEEDLRKSQAQLQAILDNVGIGIALISPEMRILSLNRQMREWFPEIDPGERPICYESYNDPPGEEPCSYCPTIRTLRDGQVHEAVSETPQDGQVRNYRIVSSPVQDRAGRVSAAIEMVEDCTERTEADRRLKESLAELARFNRQAVGRELRMIELKREVNEMAERAGVDPPYDLSFVDDPEKGDERD